MVAVLLVILASVAVLLVAMLHPAVARASERRDDVESPFRVEPLAGPRPWSHLNARDPRRDFRFAIIADRTGGTREGRFQQAIEQINGLQPDFCIHIGDVIEGAPNNMDEVNAQWDDAETMLARIEPPLFLVPGNHDVNNLAQIEVWKRRKGPLHYHFLYENVLFIVLNSEDPPSKQLSDEQVGYVAHVLGNNPHVRWTFVFVHVPLWIYDHVHNWEKVDALLQGRNYTVFAGHMHEYIKETRHDQHYITVASTGAWTHGRGTAFGEFDHITWVAMAKDRPRITNLMLDGILGENVRTAELRDELQPFRWCETVHSTGVRVEGGEFCTGTATLTVENPLTRPIDAKVLIHPSRQTRVHPTSFIATLEAGERKDVTVRLDAPRPVALNEVDPVRVTWTMQSSVAGREPLVLEGTHRIVIDGVHTCPRRISPIVVDGHLDDWPDLAWRCVEPGQVLQTPEQWDGPGDASFDFGVQYDDSYVYIAVHVYDDILRFRGRQEPWRKDGLIVRLDARPESEREFEHDRWQNPEMNSEFARYFGRYPGPGAFDQYLFLGLSLGATPDETTVFQRDRLPDGVQCVCQRVEDGYTAEIAVPSSYLDERQGGAWESFRLNLSVNDYDDSYAAPHAAISWRPEWNSAEDVPGSGTFRRG